MSAPWASGSWRRFLTVRYYLKTLRSRNDVPPSVVVTFADTKQTIDGFGAANSHQGLTSALADLFFTTIGLSLFRLPFSSGGVGAYESETTTFYADAALAGARGALVWAAPWTASPASWKDNLSLVAGNCSPAHYGDWAAKMAGLQADLVLNSAPTLYGMSVGNEPDFTATYESMLWSAANMVTFIKNNLGPALAALTPRPLLIAPECENWDNTASYLATIQADSAAYAYVDIIATHQYEGTVAPLNTTKKVWETEMSSIGGVFDASITEGLLLAARVHSAMTTGNVNAWHAWWTRNDQANNLGLIGNSGDDTLTKRLYVLGQYAKFVRPGMVRVGVAGSLAGVSMTAYKNTSTGAHALVAINASAVPVSSVFGFAGLAVSSVTPYITDATRDLAAQTAIGVVNNRFAATLPALSVTTFSGAGA